MRVRIQFRKFGCMKFVGHLDLMRYFQKAIKRAGIDIAYSEGYNPHQKMSFASPLGLGLTGAREYLDIDINTFIPSDMAIKALNDVMVDGIEINEFSYLEDTAQNAMSSIQAAEYLVSLKEEGECCIFSSVEALNAACEAFFAQEEIIVTKETKKGESTFDLKPFVFDWEAINVPFGVGVSLNLILKAGSETNIKPEFVLTNLLRYHKQDEDLIKFQFHRIDLYTLIDNEYISLGDIGNHVTAEIHFN